MSCAVNTSGQATSFSTNRIEDNEVKTSHKPLTSFFISDILSGEDKKVKTLSTSSSSSSPAPDDDYEKKHHVADDVDFLDQKSQQLSNFHQQLFRLQQQHRHHQPLSFPHQFLFAQSSLFNPRLERELAPQHHHHNPNPIHHHHHHHHQQQQQQQRLLHQQHLSEQQRIYDKKRHHHHHQPPSPIKRPWDEESSRSPRASDDIIKSDEEIEVDVSSYETDDDDVTNRPSSDSDNKMVCPLDALLRMTSQTFEPEAGSESCSNNNTNSCSSKQNNNNNSNNSNNSSSSGNKKRRKSRTAFTNKQIFELEKRFVYQKYLTPVDRDDIAQSLGLTNAQVITWFQNRRAKLKRDMEELKADVIAAKTLGKEPVANVIIGGIEELLQGTRDSLRKKPPQKSSHHHHPIVNSSATNHDRRHYNGVYDSSRISRGRRSPSSDWSSHVRADQSEKENSDVSSVKSDDVMK